MRGERMSMPGDHDDALVPGEALDALVASLRREAVPVSGAQAAAIAAQARLAAGAGGRRADDGRRRVPWRPVAWLAAAGVALVVGVREVARRDATDGAATVATTTRADAPAADAPRGDAPLAPVLPATGAAFEAPVAPIGARSVRLAVELPAARAVHVVGDFNLWRREATPLVRDAATGRWTVLLQLPPGRYRYAFLVDGRTWRADAAHERVRDDDFGVPTSELVVEASP